MFCPIEHLLQDDTICLPSASGGRAGSEQTGKWKGRGEMERTTSWHRLDDGTALTSLPSRLPEPSGCARMGAAQMFVLQSGGGRRWRFVFGPSDLGVAALPGALLVVREVAFFMILGGVAEMSFGLDERRCVCD